MNRSVIKEWLKSLASLSLFFRLCVALGLAMLVGTLKPDWDIYHSFWFIAMLGLLGVNTIACVITRWKSIPWPSLASHFGILCILAGGATSLALGRGGQLSLSEEGPALTQVRASDGSVELRLPFQVKLKKFNVEYHGLGRHEVVLVNQKGEQETLWVEPGMRYTAQDGHAKLEVLDFNPDFYIDSSTHHVGKRSNFPRNPALRVRLTASPKKEFWVFQNFPGMHQENQPLQVGYAYHPPTVKQYKSLVEIRDESGKAVAEEELWVNKPLYRDGFRLYQSSFDPNDPSVSVISVRRDPGTPLVYLGFMVLMLGLSWNAMRRIA